MHRDINNQLIDVSSFFDRSPLLQPSTPMKHTHMPPNPFGSPSSVSQSYYPCIGRDVSSPTSPLSQQTQSHDTITITNVQLQLKLVRDNHHHHNNNNEYRVIASVSSSQAAIPDDTIRNIERNCIQHRVHHTQKTLSFSMSLDRLESFQISDFLPSALMSYQRHRHRHRNRNRLQVVHGLNFRYVHPEMKLMTHHYHPHRYNALADVAKKSDHDNDNDSDSDLEILNQRKRKRKLEIFAPKTFPVKKRKKHVQISPAPATSTSNTNTNMNVDTTTTTTTTSVSNADDNEMSDCSQSERPQLLAGTIHRDNHGVRDNVNSSVKPECSDMDMAMMNDDIDDELQSSESNIESESEKKRLFQIAVQKQCPYLQGNTEWSDGEHGPNGLHKTPLLWCRYCGSRVSDKWHMKGRICGKHQRCLYFENKKIWRRIFDPHHKELLPHRPLDASQNAELQFLKEFAEYSKLDAVVGGGCGGGAMKEEKEEDDEEVQPFFDVYKIHSTMNLVHTDTGVQLNFYLIEWKGYDIGACSWEPEDNLQCDEKLVEFDGRIEAHDKYPECVECNKYGAHWKVYKRPCFTHHFDHPDYKDVFEAYPRTNIRRLAGVTLSMKVIKEYHQRLAGQEHL